MFKLRSGARSRSKAIYTNVPYVCELPFNPQDFYPVDVYHNLLGISIVGDWYIASLTVPHTNSSLEEAFRNLPLAIQQTCGNIHFPSDNGEQILHQIMTLNSSLFGASDASFKNGRASHAWILSSGNIDDIVDPDCHISGSGPVHSTPQYLSSARGELQGITAISIISALFAKFHNQALKVSSICNNRGIISKCTEGTFSSLHQNRDANIDLYLT
jgi:hypothetical protein